LNERLVETGTTISSEASHDFSVLALRGVRQHWNEAWDLFSQVALHPTFPASDVEVVRARMLDQVKRIPDDPDSYLTFLADSALYAGHPYAARPGGTPASLAGIQRDALADWHRRRLTKENLLIVVVGNTTRDDVTAKIASAFGGLPARGGAAVRVAIDVLGDRLFEEVRTKRNLTYAVGAGLASRATNLGSLYVTAVEPDTTLKVIFSEVRRLQREPLTPATLAENVSTFITQFWLGQQSSMGQAAQLGAFELVGGGWENLYRFVDAVRRVTPADVQRAATTYLQDARFAVIGDPTKINRTLISSF
jgi:zinc protease